MKKIFFMIAITTTNIGYASQQNQLQAIAKTVSRCAGTFLVVKMIHESNKNPDGAKYFNARAVAFLQQSYGVLGQQETNAIAKSVVDSETKNFNDNVPGTSARVSKIVKTCEDLGKEAGF